MGIRLQRRDLPRRIGPREVARVCRLAGRVSLLVVLCACGDDAVHDGVTGGSPRDAGEAGLVLPPIIEPPADAGAEAGPRVFPRMDAGHDAGHEDDAGRPSCKDLDCSKLDGPCKVGVCDEATIRCVAESRADGTHCGSGADNACTAPDTCGDGVCRANHTSAGAPCGDQGVVCHFDDMCDGKGHCEDSGFVVQNTPCGDASDSECDDPDSCDEFGRCVARHASTDTPCGDQDVPCHFDDTCDGQGLCGDAGLWTIALCPMGAYGGACRCGTPGVEAPLGECHPVPDLCDVSGQCVSGNALDNLPCGDQGVLCRYDDLGCENGRCKDGGMWIPGSCPMGESSGMCRCGGPGEPAIDGVCHLQLDLCDGDTCVSGDAPDATPCGSQTQTECSGANGCLDGICDASDYLDSTPCGDPTNTVCNPVDTCDGSGGCVARLADAGTVCEETPGVCFLAPACDGSGSCLPADFAPVGTACGDPTDTECNPEDTCDGSGSCDVQVTDQGVACGDPADGECTDPDSCNGAGSCDPHDASMGAACGSQGQACHYDDSCDGGGGCTDNGVMVPCAMLLTGTVSGGGGPVPDATVEVVGASPPSATTTDANGQFSLLVPIDVETHLRIGDAIGFWDAIVTRTFTAGTLSGFTWTLRTEVEINAIAAALGPPLAVDPGQAIVYVAFGGSAPYGGSGATSSAPSSPSVVPTGPGMYAYSPNLVDSSFPEMWFFNTDLVGTTTLTPFGNGLNVCNVTGGNNPFPVVTHAITSVDVACN